MQDDELFVETYGMGPICPHNFIMQRKRKLARFYRNTISLWFRREVCSHQSMHADLSNDEHRLLPFSLLILFSIMPCDNMCTWCSTTACLMVTRPPPRPPDGCSLQPWCREYEVQGEVTVQRSTLSSVSNRHMGPEVGSLSRSLHVHSSSLVWQVTQCNPSIGLGSMDI